MGLGNAWLSSAGVPGGCSRLGSRRPCVVPQWFSTRGLQVGVGWWWAGPSLSPPQLFLLPLCYILSVYKKILFSQKRRTALENLKAPGKLGKSLYLKQYDPRQVYGFP